MGAGGKSYSWNDTEVYWNMDDYPIPVGIDDLGSIRTNIVEALDRFGFHGEKSISVHCKQLDWDVMEELRKAGICYVPACTMTYMKAAALNKVTSLDMTAFLLQIALVTEPMNFAVIAKPNVELVRVLKCLKSRGHTLLLIDPPNDDEECLFGVESLLGCAHLILGASDSKEEEEEDLSQGEEEKDLSQGEEEDDLSHGEENEDLSQGDEEEEEEDISHGEEEEEEEDLSHGEEEEEDLSHGEEEEEDLSQGEEDPYKVLDFLEPMGPILLKEAMTPVFWDAEDFPFPSCSTPDEIYNFISSALLDREFSDKVTIWAYLDGDKKDSWRDALLGDKTWASRIYFFPAGDKASRRIRMANDILFWAKESSGKPFQESLFLFSDQFRGDPYYVELLHNLVSGRLDIFFVTPTQDINKPESPEWPGLLIDEGSNQLLFETCEIPDEPCPKKRKADAGVVFILEAEEETSGMDYVRLWGEPWPAGLPLDGRACYPFGDETSQSSEGSELAGLLCLL